jgi:hypothetical protein
MTEPLDADDIVRVRRAENQALELVMRALRMVPEPFWGIDSRFIGYTCRMRAEHLTDRQREHVNRVAWRLRRYLPQHIKPRANPDDPIVRELAQKDRVHG